MFFSSHFAKMTFQIAFFALLFLQSFCGTVFAREKCDFVFFKPDDLLSGLPVNANRLIFEFDEKSDEKNVTVLDGFILKPHAWRLEYEKLDFEINKKSLTLKDFSFNAFDAHCTPFSLFASFASCSVKKKCRLKNAVIDVCSAAKRSLTVSAQEIEVDKENGIYLKRPVFKIGKMPFFAMPFLKIVQEGKPGFLPPKIGWDAIDGPVFGPAAFVPITDKASLTGHLAARGIHGMETHLSLESENSHLDLNYGDDSFGRHFALVLDADAGTRPGEAHLNVDFITDRRIFDNLALNPLERASDHKTSAARWTSNFHNLVLEFHTQMSQLIPEENSLTRDNFFSRSQVAVSLPLLPLDTFFMPGFTGRIQRFDYPEQKIVKSEFSPVLTIPLTVGPTGLKIEAKSLHTSFSSDENKKDNHKKHSVGLTGETSLELARKYRSFVHRIKGIARYHSTFTTRNIQHRILDYSSYITKGHAVVGILSTTFSKKNIRRFLYLSSLVNLNLPGFPDEWTPGYQAFEMKIQNSFYSFKADLAWDMDKKTISNAGFMFNLSVNPSSLFFFGPRWLGEGQGPHTDLSTANESYDFLLKNINEKITVAELNTGASFKITSCILSKAGMRIGLMPQRKLNVLYYGLTLHPGCTCLRINITASHRPGRLAPDVMVLFSLWDK